VKNKIFFMRKSNPNSNLHQVEKKLSKT
jgi:hypothetical protein